MTKILIGVTGHRVLPHPGTGECIARALRHLAKTWPGATFRIVSSLAEGSDREVVHLARTELNAELIAVLPMPARAFEKDFANPKSVSEFRELLRTARKIVVAPLLSSGTAWKTYSEERNHQYAWASAYVARNADVLIAIWDGQPPRGTGGTAYAVDWFRKGSTPRAYAMSKFRLRRGLSDRHLVHINSATLAVKRSRYSA